MATSKNLPRVYTKKDMTIKLTQKTNKNKMGPESRADSHAQEI